MPTCKACLGKRQHSVFAHITSRGDFIGDKEYTFTRYSMQDCNRCNGTGVEHISIRTTEDYILGCLTYIIILVACILLVMPLLSYLYFVIYIYNA